MISFFLEHITKCQWCLIGLSFDFVCMLCLWRSSTSMDTLCVFKCAWSRQRLHRHKHTRTLILLFYPRFTLVAHTLVSTCHSSSSGGFVFIAFYMFFTELISPESAQFFSFSRPLFACCRVLYVYTNTSTHICEWVYYPCHGWRLLLYVLFSVLVICSGLDAKYEL